MHALAKVGVLGALAFLGTYILVVKRLLWNRPRPGWQPFQSNILFVLLFSQLVFYLAYNTGFEQAIFFGWAIASVTGIPAPSTLKRERLPNRCTDDVSDLGYTVVTSDPISGAAPHRG